jgi:GntR family transcriptional regulator
MPEARRNAARPWNLELDPRLRTPAYLQIVQQLRLRTNTGRLPAGAQLPTVRDLARRLGVNFNTVARAYRILVREGRISTQPGRGTFVLSHAARRRSGSDPLRALAKDFVDHAVAMQSSDEEILRAIQRALPARRSARASGDNHE